MTKLVGSDKADQQCSSKMLNLNSDETIDLIRNSTHSSIDKVGMKNFELLKMLGTGGKLFNWKTLIQTLY